MAAAEAAVVRPGRSTADAVAAVNQQLAGWRVSTEDQDLVVALVATGAELRRRALIMQCALGPAGDREPDLSPFTARSIPTTMDPALWAPILPSWRAAFPPGHEDHLDVDDDGALAFFRRLVDGSEMGPLHRSSCVVVGVDGTVLAGILVNIRSRDPRASGPWIADVWRDPAVRGTGMGARLIARAQHQLAIDGHRTLTLAVTRGNDAERSYAAAGFSVVMDARILHIPARAG